MFPCVTYVFRRLCGLRPYHEEMTCIPHPFNRHLFISPGNEMLQQMWHLRVSHFIDRVYTCILKRGGRWKVRGRMRVSCFSISITSKDERRTFFLGRLGYKWIMPQGFIQGVLPLRIEDLTRHRVKIPGIKTDHSERYHQRNERSKF